MQIRVAACQIECTDGDREGNFTRIEQSLQQLGNVNIACFPECSLLGWVNPAAHQLAHPIPGADTDRLGELARKYNTMIIIGLAEREGDKLYDSAVIIDSKGKILLKHRKINLLKRLMDPPYSSGSAVQIAETQFGRIGLLICADTFKPKILKKMKKIQPNLLVVPYGWAAEENKWPDHGKLLEKLVKKLGKNFHIPVIGTDVVGQISTGPWKGQIYGGQSVISDREGKVLAIGKDRIPDILIQEIEIDI